MTWLVTSDLHLTERPEHAYRFEFMEWLAAQAVAQKATSVIICGDISDAKDRHSSVLVNAVADAIHFLSTCVEEVHIMYGNHDGPSADRAFWVFLRRFPNVRYYTSATITPVGRNPVLFAPYGTEEAAEKLLRGLTGIRHAFLHATVDGAVVENGMQLKGGVSSQWGQGLVANVFSGDVHVPQVCGNVEYIGAPYCVHFGDCFMPRVICLDPSNDANRVDLHFPGPRLHHLKLDINNRNLPHAVKAGDRVKFTVTSAAVMVSAMDWHDYKKTMREACDSVGAQFHSAVYITTRTPEAAEAPSPRRSDEAIVRTYGERAKMEPVVIEAGVGFTK